MATVNRTKAEKGTAPPVRRDPVRSRANILQAALDEFSQKGLQGARVDEIARRAGANKRMIYHYFGNKEELFLAVLEFAYGEIRDAEQELHLEDLGPEEAMQRLVAFTFDYFVQAPHFVPLLNSENLHGARHLRRSSRIREMHSPIIHLLDDLLARGAQTGLFRAGIDPVQLFISIAGVSYFYFSNIHTLSTIFGRDFTAESERDERKRHVVELVLNGLRP